MLSNSIQQTITGSGTGLTFFIILKALKANATEYSPS
jgi:hypothetical protein